MNQMILKRCEDNVGLSLTSVLSCRSIRECPCSSMESFSVLSSSLEEKDDDDDDDEEEEDDDGIELFLEIIEQSIEDNDEEDNESNILSTKVDSPSNNWMIDVWSCHCSSVVLHLQRDILQVFLLLLYVGYYNYRNTIEFFHPKK